MTYATYKTLAVFSEQSALTPCIFDDDPTERDSLTHSHFGHWRRSLKPATS
jgi:hypothetical protein